MPDSKSRALEFHHDVWTGCSPAPSVDLRYLRGPFDIIGDIHGCADELERLLRALGWCLLESDGCWRATHPEGRMLVFLGDLIDRGPASVRVLRMAVDLVGQGVAVAVLGNHDLKLCRALNGREVPLSHGLDVTLAALAREPEEFRTRVRHFLTGLEGHYVLDAGRLVVAHGGMKESLIGQITRPARLFAIYGDADGSRDSLGRPMRRDWAAHYVGDASVVYGHTPVTSAHWRNNTICVDTACVFGGELTAVRWPERTVVAVRSTRNYHGEGAAQAAIDDAAAATGE